VETNMMHLKRYTFVRFEGEYGVLEDEYGRLYDVRREELADDLREGDILQEYEGKFIVNEEETAKQREKLKRIYDHIVKKY